MDAAHGTLHEHKRTSTGKNKNNNKKKILHMKSSRHITTSPAEHPSARPSTRHSLTTAALQQPLPITSGGQVVQISLPIGDGGKAEPVLCLQHTGPDGSINLLLAGDSSGSTVSRRMASGRIPAGYRYRAIDRTHEYLSSNRSYGCQAIRVSMRPLQPITLVRAIDLLKRQAVYTGRDAISMAMRLDQRISDWNGRMLREQRLLTLQDLGFDQEDALELLDGPALPGAILPGSPQRASLQ